MQGFVTQIIGIMSRKKKVAENESLKEEPKKELEIR